MGRKKKAAPKVNPANLTRVQEPDLEMAEFLGDMANQTQGDDPVDEKELEVEDEADDEERAPQPQNWDRTEAAEALITSAVALGVASWGQLKSILIDERFSDVEIQQLQAHFDRAVAQHTV